MDEQPRNKGGRDPHSTLAPTPDSGQDELSALPELPSHSGFAFPDISGYVIESELGKGAHGQVFKAIDMSLNKPVAIKVLNRLASQEASLRERFEREIRAYHSLKDGRVIQLRNHGQITRGPFKDCPYVIMEFMDGGTFGHWLDHASLNSKAYLRGGIEILVDVCKGLTYLHKQKIVHRDLKPDNILLAELEEGDEGSPSKPGQVRLSDFGLIANLRESRELSRTGMGAGTPAYMSPEQFVDAKNVTPASDQYAIGVMLYELLCSRRPWQESAEEPEAIGLLESKARTKTPCPPPSTSTQKVDGRLREICLRCLEPNPSERYANVDELRESLEAWLSGDIDPHTRSWLKRTWRRAVLHPIRRRPGRFLTTIIASILFALGGSWTWGQYAYVWPHVAYYNDIVERWGIFEGIQPLSPEKVAQKPLSYRVTTQGFRGRITKVERVNGHLFAVENPDRFVFGFLWGDYTANAPPIDAFRQRESTYEYTYSSANELASIVATSKDNTPLWRRTYTNRSSAKHENLLPVSTLETVGVMDPGTGVPTAKMLEFTYDEAGHTTRVAVSEVHGGEESLVTQRRDSLGRIVQRGNTFIDYLPDEIVISTRNAEGALSSDSSVAQYRVKLDALNRPHEISYYGDGSLGRESGRPVRGSMGENLLVYNYGAHGDLEKIEYRGEDGKLKANLRGIATIQREHDQQGREIRFVFFDEAGNVTGDNDGQTGGLTIYDDSQASTIRFSLGIDQEPIGVGTRKWINAQGLAHSVAYFDTADNPVANREGIHRRDGVLNKFGFLERLEFRDTNSRLITNSDGIARLDREPDALGRVRRQRYYDEYGEAVAIWDGEYGREITYDSIGRETYVTFLGADGAMSDTNAGYAFYQNLWDLQDRRWYNAKREQVMPVLEVTEIEPDAGGAKGGLLVGDKIIQYAGQYAPQASALGWLIRHQEEFPVKLGILRGESPMLLSVTEARLGIGIEEKYIETSLLAAFEAHEESN